MIFYVEALRRWGEACQERSAERRRKNRSGLDLPFVPESLLPLCKYWSLHAHFIDFIPSLACPPSLQTSWTSRRTASAWWPAWFLAGCRPANHLRRTLTPCGGSSARTRRWGAPLVHCSSTGGLRPNSGSPFFFFFRRILFFIFLLFFSLHNTCIWLPVALPIPHLATHLHPLSTVLFTPYPSLSPAMARISLIHRNIMKPLNR